MEAKYVKDAEGNIVAPATHESVVMDSENTPLDVKLENMADDIKSGEARDAILKNRVNELDGRISAIEGLAEISVEGGDVQVVTNPTDVVSGGSGVPTGNAVRGAIDVASGYYVCETAGATANKAVSITGFVLPASGGAIKVRMTNRNSAASGVRLVINSDTVNAKELYYEGKAVSASNTWEDGEVVTLYYDGTRWQANNVAGGGNGDSIFDISVYNGMYVPAMYSSLSAALSGNNVPPKYRKGGMSVKFIKSTDAVYSVVVSTADAAPAGGIALVSASSVTDGNYSEDELSDFATLPSGVGAGNAVTYYYEDGGSYTVWTITMVSDVVSEYVQYRLMATTWSTIESDWQGVDDEPTAGSENVVKSGGVYNELALGAVYDVSAKNPTAGSNNDGKWESLSALLSDVTLSTLIPTSVRKGGMSIKFVQSTDNKYVQYRLMANAFSTTESDWQGVDIKPTAESHNLVESGGAYAMVGEKTSGVLPVEELPTFNGWLDSSNKIVSFGQAKFCVIKIKEGDVINKSGEALSFAMIVNSFDYNYTLPYIPDYATGESGRRSLLNYYIVPAGAKHLLLTVADKNGNSILPSTFTINGIDVLNTTLRDTIFVNAAKIKDIYSVFNGIKESPILYNGYIDGSNQIVDYHGSKYFAIKANGGQVLQAEGARLCVVKSFDYTHSLPYSIDFADGETAIRTGKVDITLPADTEYVLVSYNYAGTNNYPSYLSLDGGPNLMLSLDENIEKVYKSIDDVSFNILGIRSLTKHDGWIDSSNKIVNAYNAKYVVIKINGGDVITKSFVQYGNFFILSDYNVPQNLPYSVVFATGTTGLFNDVYKLTTPSDANYIALAVERNGASLLPEKFEINGVDIAESINNKIQTIESSNQKYTKISNYIRLVGHLDGSNKIVSWKQSKHIVVPITDLRGAELYLSSLAATSALAFVKSYTYNPVLPYTLDMSEEEANIITIPSDALGGVTVEVPSDANYMILRANYQDGTDNLPSLVMVNGKYNLSQDYFTNNITKTNLPYVYSQKTDLKIVNVSVPTRLGNNGMCTIDGVLCSAYGSGIYIKGTSDTLIGSQLKYLGISVHYNDLDYCIYTDTLITAVIPTVDGGVMQLCLLQDAYAKLYSNDELVEGDWLLIDMPSELDSDYIMVSNCFGESCDILYCILIDRTQNFTNKNKRILKIQLEMNSDGTSYTGNYTIIFNKPLPYITEIQGSKYCNGKLYVSTDNYLNTTQRHSSITVIDIETLDAVEHISYVNQAELSKSIEAEGVSFVDDKLYQITILHPADPTAPKIRQLRCFDRFCL